MRTSIRIRTATVFAMTTFSRRPFFLPSFALAIFFLFPKLVTAQERITLTSYYPTTGKYRTIRVMPSSTCWYNALCSTQGEICYSSSSNEMLVCDASGQWALSGYWRKGSIPNHAYFTGNVTIGLDMTPDLNKPANRLNILGSSNICVRRYYTSTSSTTNCPAGYFLAIPNASGAATPGGVAWWDTVNPQVPESFYLTGGSSYIMCCRTCGSYGTFDNATGNCYG